MTYTAAVLASSPVSLWVTSTVGAATIDDAMGAATVTAPETVTEIGPPLAPGVGGTHSATGVWQVGNGSPAAPYRTDHATMEALVLATAWPTGGRVGSIMYRRVTSGGILQLFVDVTGHLTARKASGSNPFTLAAPAPLALHRAYHVAVTYNGSSARLYIDGAEVATHTFSTYANLGTASNLHVGGTGNQENLWHGWWSHAAYYDRALTPAEITDHFTAAWPPPEPEPEPIPQAGPRLFLGAPPVNITGDAFTVTVRRGSSPDLPTPRLEAGWLRATVEGATVRPDLHPHARPGRPVRLMLHSREDDMVFLDEVATGTLTSARIEYPGKSDDRMRVVLEAVDVLGLAAGTPSPGPLRAGRFADRVADVLTGTDLPAEVIDTTPAAPGPRRVLPGDAASVLDHLALIRDTTHASVTTTRGGAIKAVADRDRPALADDPTPAFLLTDAAMPPAGPKVIHYTELQPDFDTTNLVNVITVTKAGNASTYSVPESVAEWGPAPAAVTVNDGRPGGHAARHMAERVTPQLTVTRVVYDATNDPRQAVTPELGDVCRVQRVGLVDDLAEVIAIEHNLSASTRRGGIIRWTVALELRPLVIPPHRWADVPPAIRWADVPPALTWTTAAAWRP